MYIDSITGEVINTEYSTFRINGFLTSILPFIGFMVVWLSVVIFNIVNQNKKRNDKAHVSRNSMPQFNASYDANKETKEVKETNDEDPFADYYNKTK